MNLIEEHAKELAGIEGWEAYHFEKLPHGGATQVFLIRGAVSEKNKKGKTIWPKSQSHTERQFYISTREQAAWIDAWEKRTGKCSRCCGDGKSWCGWGANDGNRYGICEKCGGDGKAR